MPPEICPACETVAHCSIHGCIPITTTPMISLTLPYPISANRYWASRVIRVDGIAKAVTYVTKEAKDFREQVGWIARAAGVREPMQGRLDVRLRLYPHRPQDWARRARKLGPTWDDDVLCMDLTNCEKVLLDALNGIAFVDDKQVRRYSAERMEPDGKGARVELVLEQIAVEQPQEALL
jgi:crossover junction endodeoxyribonuclease RusA